MKKVLSKIFRPIKLLFKKVPVILWISILCCAGFLLLTVCNHYWGTENEFHIDAVKALQAALIAGAFVTPITQIVSKQIIKATKKDKKLREYGVQDIGTGVYSYEDEAELFGSNFSQKPQQLDLLFLSGNGFLEKYKRRVISLIQNGCNVRILLVRPLLEGKPNEFILRYGETCEPNNKSLAHQICRQTLPIIQDIERATVGAPGSIEIRTYVDEFRTNQRFATYLKAKEENSNLPVNRVRCHINVQASTIIAQKLSLLLRGSVDFDEENKKNLSETNLMFNGYVGFEELWKKYENSRPNPDDYLPFKKVWKPDED